MPPSPARVVVLTGATRGLGRALVPELAARGHTVVGCGRSAPAIDALRRAHGAPHAFAGMDVGDDGQVAAWAAWTGS